jgi:hypothetical protein
VLFCWGEILVNRGELVVALMQEMANQDGCAGLSLTNLSMPLKLRPTTSFLLPSILCQTPSPYLA